MIFFAPFGASEVDGVRRTPPAELGERWCFVSCSRVLADFTAICYAVDCRGNVYSRRRVFLPFANTSENSTHASDTVNGRHDTPTDVARLESAYTALRSYVESIESSPKGPPERPTKLAEADNAVDALREFFQKGVTPKPSDAPPVPKTQESSGSAEHSRRRDKRRFEGLHDLPCERDHPIQPHIDGQARKTQKGKFECESCHGPGSAHVNAGGGRGVGGLITYRPATIRGPLKRAMRFALRAMNVAIEPTGMAVRTRHTV